MCVQTNVHYYAVRATDMIKKICWESLKASQIQCISLKRIHME